MLDNIKIKIKKKKNTTKLCDFSKNFEKLEKSQFLLLRANQDISGRDTLIFSRAVFLAFVFLKQET